LTDSEYYQNLSNISTVTSVSKDIDELSSHLSHVFRSFPNEPSEIKESSYYRHPIGSAHKNYGFDPNSTSNTNPLNMLTTNYMNYVRNMTDKGIQADAPFSTPTQLSAGRQSTKPQHSLEAIKAVEEYKRRQEEERKRVIKLEDTIRADEFTDRPNQHRYPNTEPNYYRSQNQSQESQYTKPQNQDQIINNYYNNIVKKTRYESSDIKNIHDLYKNRPKHGRIIILFL
jgi:hypothetical protein